MKKSIVIFTTFVLSFLGAGSVTATGLPWNNHAPPFTFLFGNDIDGHQQTLLNGDTLFGFFYIKFTGAKTSDGYRVATHVDCNTTTGCTVGWLLQGERSQGALVYVPPTDHPLFLIRRADIPEPGAYAHFHWLGYAGTLPPIGQRVTGYFLQLTAIDTFCFIHMIVGPINAGKTCSDNGGVVVEPGTDIATHVNIVTSFPGF